MPLLGEAWSPSWEENRLDLRTRFQDNFFIPMSASFRLARRLFSAAAANQHTYIWSLQCGSLKAVGHLRAVQCPCVVW